MATYEIYTLEQLQRINADYPDPGDPGHLADDCVLMNDIDAEDPDLLVDPDAVPVSQWNPVAGELGNFNGFNPIGQSGTPFTGTFDGGGFTISNLYINWDDRRCGLFGAVSRIGAADGGFIKDLTIKDADINCTASANVLGVLSGSVTGKATGDRCNIDNITITGLLNGTDANQFVGGMVHESVYTDWTDCSSGVSIVSASGEAGGFVNIASDSIFLRCTSSGSISIVSAVPNSRIGGFVGRTTGSPEFKSCSCSVAISFTNLTHVDPIMGIGGFIGDPDGGDFLYCVASGTIVVDIVGTAIIGGFAGASGGVYNECGANVSIICPQIAGDNGLVSGIGGFIGSGSLCTNCYARGDVCKSGIENNHSSLDLRLGGFAGTLSGSTKCYATGLIGIDTVGSGNAVVRGGFTGSNGGTITLSHWDTDTSGLTDGAGTGGSAGLTGHTTADMKLESTYTSWDFAAIWDIPTYTQPAINASNLTVWFSKTGDYENFEGGAKDSDAFSLAIPTTNEIKWIDSMEALLVGTSGAEWKIASNKIETRLSPTNFSVRKQTTYGSKQIQSLGVNASILFVDFVGRKLREMTFDDVKQKYTSPDLAELAEHITKTGIVNMAHQKNPESMIWCVLEDGTPVNVVYNRDQDVVAWSTQPIGGVDTVVQSAMVVPGANEDEVWISVSRTINSATKVYIERFGLRDYGDDQEDAFFVDSGITYDGAATGTITGLDHLEGETVAVWADGVEFDQQTVASGQITLELDGVATNASVVQVGLPFTSILRPERLTAGNQGHTNFGLTKRVNDLHLVFLKSINVKYGASEDELFDVEFPDTNLFSGDLEVHSAGGFSVEAPIIIQTSSPAPLNLLAIISGIETTGE